MRTRISYIDALNNWWGTSYTSEIGQTLYHDDRYQGGINFVPYLNAPNPETPALPTEFHSLSTPTSPPTPTPMPSQTQTVPEGFLGLGWLQVAVLAATAASVGLAVGVFVLRRRAKPA
ncbi:MAG: hypothetical protein NWE93_13655 [Candidatus Bathyarchaeota archaeon]|nr:hypothetical protein [Candidatus Bathyarchaeota archaeon]